ncbi:flagellar hook-length control protein FliK [Listeria monocytogenes]|uniref:flagellar hook-length control protein FliK n=1 Tax=Listeria monocytogenes TaxID=1639 RepID=UPI000EDAEFCD|nr:flagellar hook-length control protein FliK [Listeria monocytogenes]EHC5295170.1 flagellar hook-length control protein FliK [Listeria monocytogenes serotype 1/2a]EAC8234497.1 flagellar hook-length control protein FliK [Listeria monocytogenes]EAE1810975.1 flagellar hook-length control protein FliK [Listeria monocytogenes]EIU7099727.1 flagellar hook-length control protein FliK [Listeria monocytogenes]EKJ9013032.1 flagellar hook-length control protein FliK [Listeria monocytogenes]
MLIPDNLLQPVVGKKQVEPKESLAEELVELPFISLLMENSPAPLIKGEADNEEQATIPLKEIAPSLVSAKLLDSEPETKLPSAPLELKEVKETLAAIAKQAIDQPKIDSAPQVAQPPEMNTPKEPTKNTTREQQPPPELIMPTKDSPKLAENVAKNQPALAKLPQEKEAVQLFKASIKEPVTVKEEVAVKKPAESSNIWHDTTKQLTPAAKVEVPVTLKQLDKTITDQIEQLQKFQVKQNKAFFAIQPESLGKVEVLLKKMPDKIFVHIEYQEQTAKQKLEQMAQDLHNRFRDRGVEVAVTMAEKQAPKENGQGSEGRHHGESKKEKERENPHQEKAKQQVFDLEEET